MKAKQRHLTKANEYLLPGIQLWLIIAFEYSVLLWVFWHIRYRENYMKCYTSQYLKAESIQLG